MTATDTETLPDLPNLDPLIDKQYKPAHLKKEGRDWRTYEQQLVYRIRTTMQDFQPLINQACYIHCPPRRGRSHTPLL